MHAQNSQLQQKWGPLQCIYYGSVKHNDTADFNTNPAEVNNLNFQPPEFVSRYAIHNLRWLKITLQFVYFEIKHLQTLMLRFPFHSQYQ